MLKIMKLNGFPKQVPIKTKCPFKKKGPNMPVPDKLLSLLLGMVVMPIESNLEPQGSDKVDTYRAAVYEHEAIGQADPTAVPTRSQALGVIMDNLKIYEQQAAIASKQNVSIIVFPESGLYGIGHTRASIYPYLEEVTDVGVAKNIPCDDNLFPPVQRYLSCIAKNNSMYVVANMGDIRICNKVTNPACPEDGRFQFSTNVVYDDEGKQVACYHKHHLFNESRFDPAPLAEHSTFKTPFGKFATLIHEDMFFNDTVVYLWWNYKINSFAVTSAARNDFPYTIPIVAHRGFSMLFLNNVLSAGLKNPQTAYGGSGLFSENCGVYQLDLNKTGGQLLIRDMPVKANKSKPCGPYMQHRQSGVYDVNMIDQRMTNIFRNEEHNLPRTLHNTPDHKAISDISVIGNEVLKSRLSQSNLNLHKQDKRKTSKSSQSQQRYTSISSVEDWVPDYVINFQNLVMGDRFTMAPLTADNHVLQVCQGNNEHCCSLYYNFRSNPDHELYVLGAYMGNRTEGAKMFVRVCVLLKCRSTELKSCGEDVRSATTTFDTISLMSGADTIFMLPYVVTSKPDGGLGLGLEEFTYLPANFSSIRGFTEPLISITLLETYYDPY